jgi:TRAP-type C4-dicarboxylate transport system permease small subunit
VEKFLTGVSWTVSILVTFMIVVDITMRFFFNRPLPASWEISEVCMPFIIFLPFAYTLTIDSHVRVSIVKNIVPPKVQFWFEIFSNSISFVMCSMLTYWSWIHFWESFVINEEMLAAIQIPWWPGKMAMPIGMGMFAIRYGVKLYFNITESSLALKARDSKNWST